MIRIYLDSNVFRYIKHSHPSYNRELHDLMDKLKDEVLFIYSGAHLDDLKDSTQEYRIEDLSLMAIFVKDHFFFRDPIKKVTGCDHLRPLDAYNSFDFEAMDKALKNPFDFDELFEDLDDTEEGKLAKTLLENIFSKPLSSLGETLKQPNENEPGREMFDKMFPGYNPDMSLKDFMRSIGPFTGKLMQDSNEVSEMRKYMEGYLNSNSYSFHKWGMEFNEKLKDKLGKTFLEMIDGMILENQKDDFNLRFNYAYTLLEMFNITQERSGKKLKKFNYWSLNRDSDHCYFASMCDYLVTDDKGLQVKATIVYNLFGIETKILSTKDFVEQGNRFISKELNFEEFRENFIYNIENSEHISIESVIENKNVIAYYELKRTLFGFFDHMYIIDYPHRKYRTCGLSFKRGPNDNKIAFMHREIEFVVNRFAQIFGKDSKGRENYMMNEDFENGEAIRIWPTNSMEIQLVFQQEDGWVYTELHIHVAIQSNQS